MLLINPRRRAKSKTRRASAKKRRRNPVRVTRAVVARPAVRRVSRRRNPIAGLARRSARRTSARRRRNPISLGGVSVNSFIGMLKDAALGGAGAIGVDLLMGQVNGYLPESLRSTRGELNAGTAVKAFATAVLGQLLAKPTRGLSRKMAAGALAVQARDAMAGFVPASMALGYASPAAITQGTNRVGPIRGGMNAYVRGGKTPLLSAYTQSNVTPLLNRARSAREREGVAIR